MHRQSVAKERPDGASRPGEIPPLTAARTRRWENKLRLSVLEPAKLLDGLSISRDFLISEESNSLDALARATLRSGIDESVCPGWIDAMCAFVNSPEWRAPNLVDSELTYAVTSGVLEQFAQGHSAGDVLRGLVQNEYDAGGRSLSVSFAPQGLDVRGSGRVIDPAGRLRLSVMLGTGHVVGGGDVQGGFELGRRRIDRVGAELTPTPPTPPDVRVRIRRFAQHSRKRR